MLHEKRMSRLSRPMYVFCYILGLVLSLMLLYSNETSVIVDAPAVATVIETRPYSDSYLRVYAYRNRTGFSSEYSR